MNDDRIDQLLRRAADDVNAMVRSVTPPPIDDLGGRRSWPAATVTVLSILLVVAAGIGLALLAEHDDVVAPAAPPIAEATTPALSESLEHPCLSVVDISDVLADPPTSTAAWVDLGVRIDELDARVAAANPSEASTRRYDRFVALARQAAELGADGGFTPARLPARDAVAVAEDLVEFIAVPDCQFPQTDDDRSGG